MGLIQKMAGLLFGSGRNVVAQTAEVFRVNADAQAQRDADMAGQGLAQYAAEFAPRSKGSFDLAMDGVNRIPRPLMVFAMLGLFAMAMIDPIWFAARMQGLQLVPDPLWWLMGVIVSFYFGARFQMKGQEFRQSMADVARRVPSVVASIKEIQSTGVDVAAGGDVIASDNPALAAWKSEGEG
jgi:hypothetical protein